MIFRRCMAVMCTVSLVSINGFAAPTTVQQLTSDLTSDSTLISGWMADQLRYAIPFNSTSGNVIPSQLKIFGFEFGVEGVVSSTKVDTDALHNLPTTLVNTQSLDTFSRLPMPMVMGQAKIGLPFGIDGGVRFGGIPKTDENSGNSKGSIQNKVVGLDLRKKLIDEGMMKPFGLTLGLNYTHATGSFDITNTYNSNTETINGQTASIQNGATDEHADWNTNSIGAQLILDKKILFITPYIGASTNRNGGTINDSLTTSGVPVIDGTADPSQALSVTGASSADANRWDNRLLAGIEFTPLPFFRLGIGGEYAGSRNVAGSLGLRFQFR